MCDNTNSTTQSIADYLSQLLKDRKQLAAFPNVFIHVERLLDEGLQHVEQVLFIIEFTARATLAQVFPSSLPELIYYTRLQARFDISSRRSISTKASHPLAYTIFHADPLARIERLLRRVHLLALQLLLQT
ncbi:hypothetical protein TSAR_005726 [Trichomalopsis sarcophagae]|uniref:STAR protein homodimerisation region domain-containing protein n=1 Tax=Trichomalopsis sarcophagae TaxID=543379 RepID=A0A232F4L8_9HYME|nr:hypothetical protein TSAR_005726 [Trichomalopsis sarcophagae]